MAQNQDRLAKGKSRRPLGVTLLAFGVLTIAGIHLLRLFQTLKNWDFLTELPGVPPFYLASTGLIWACLGLPLGVAIWRGEARALTVVQFMAVIYASYDWFNRLFAAYRSGSLAPGFAWGFSALLTVILLVWVFWITSRPGVKAYFRRH